MEEPKGERAAATSERVTETQLPPPAAAASATVNDSDSRISTGVLKGGGATHRMMGAVSSIFHFHPVNTRGLHSKQAAPPKATTPRNLIFPEPSDAQQELPIATELAYEKRIRVDDGDDDDDNRQEGEGSHHRRHKQEPKMPPSAKKYFSPSQDDKNNEAPTDPISMAANAETKDRHHRRHLVAPPRSFHGKIQFYVCRGWQNAAHALRSARHICRHVSVQQKIAYVLILFGMLSESATPAPRYNVPIGIGVFMNSTSQFGHRTVVSGLCLAILVDFAWLLRPQEASFNGYFHAKYANYVQFCLGVCTMLKVWLVFSTYFDLGPEPVHDSDQAAIEKDPQQSLDQQQPSSSHHPIWHHIKYFFPRKTYPRCSHLSFEVLMRTLALIWIHGVCGIALLVLGILSAMLYSSKAQFRSMAFGAPLHLAMIFRSVTTLASYVVATQHMDYNGCFKLFGCHKLAQYGDDGASDIVLKYNKRWMRRVQRAKSLDGLVGLYLLLVLYSAFHSGQFFAGNGLTAVLVLTAIIVLVLDFWTPLLIMVVAKCGSLLHTLHRRGTVDVDPYYPNQLEWDEAEGSDDHGDVNSSSSDSSLSSSSGDESGSSGDSSYSSSRSSSPSSGYSTTEAGIRRRRRPRRKNRKKETIQRNSSRRRLLAPSKRKNSIPIVDADEVVSGGVGGGRAGQLSNSVNSSRSGDGKAGGIWVRHWHIASGRSYLVHSITGESVWEIVPDKNGAILDHAKMLSARKTPRNSERTPRAPGSAGRQPNRKLPASTTAASSSSPPTSDSEIVVTAVHSPRPGSNAPPLSARYLPRAANAATSAEAEHSRNELLLNPEEFLLLWDALPDGGSFVCRVSRIPHFQDLSRHLHRNRFLVASDGLNIANLRTVHFYAAVVEPSPGSDGRRLSNQLQFFLGELVFDSLSSKLYAKFRCPQQDAIVPFVKKLQLKEIVGSYAPCE